MADPYATQGGDKFGAQGNDFWLKGGEQPGFVGSAAATPEATMATPATPVSFEQPVVANPEVKQQADGSVSIPLTPAAAPTPEVPAAAAPATEAWNAASVAPATPATPSWPATGTSITPAAPPAWPTATEQTTPPATTEATPAVPPSPIDTAVDATAEAAPTAEASSAPTVDTGLPWLTQAPAAAEASPTETPGTEATPETAAPAATEQLNAVESNPQSPDLDAIRTLHEQAKAKMAEFEQETKDLDWLLNTAAEKRDAAWWAAYRFAKRKEIGTNPESSVSVN
jgi:hypothetical protein